MTTQSKDDSLSLRPFSLIEVLASVGIVMVLVTIAVGGVTIGQRMAKESRAKALLKQLEVGLQAYYKANGYYPYPGDSDTLKPLVIQGDLLDFFQIPTSDRGMAPDGYLTSSTYSVNSRYNVMSPFKFYDIGRYFYYRYPGKFNPTTFDLGCLGVNGTWGDLTYNPLVNPEPYACPDKANQDPNNKFGLGDDIVNFKRSK